MNLAEAARGAETDALAASARVGAAGMAAVYVDTSPRAQPDGERFAKAMNAIYAHLPYLDAGAVSALVTQAGASQR